MRLTVAGPTTYKAFAFDSAKASQLPQRLLRADTLGALRPRGETRSVQNSLQNMHIRMRPSELSLGR